MKTTYLAALLLLAAPAALAQRPGQIASPLAADAARALAAPRVDQRPIRLPAHPPRPATSLRQRLEAARLRYAPPPRVPDLLSPRERRRQEARRVLPPDTLGALARRAKLGERTLAAREDTRLGSSQRRDLLSRPPAQRVVRRRR